MATGVQNTVVGAALPAATGAIQSTPFLARLINDTPFLRRFVSGLVIEFTSASCPPRPHALSLWTPPGMAGAMPAWAARGKADPVAGAAAMRENAYVSWPGLVDRRFTARHLPPDADRALPPLQEVVELYRRPAGAAMKPSRSNAALLCFFAQWFTDSFLRTHPVDMRRNTSNHEIDFCQIYGLDEATTHALRAHRDGRLASRETPTGEYPALLFGPDGEPAEPFRGFDYVQRYAGTGPRQIETWMAALGITPEQTAARLPRLYATGLERGNSNIGYAACSTLFLREHNRLAGEIRRSHPSWTDDRVFQTARNSVIAIGLKLVVEDYIVQLSQTPIKLLLDPSLAPRRPWYRTNWIALEFNLLYRWHSMTPETVEVAGRTIPFADLQYNNALLEEVGLETLLDALSRQPAGYIGLGNMPDWLMGAETAAHTLSRSFALQPMNAYRKHFRLKPLKGFNALTDDPALRTRLHELYRGDIDKVEFLPGMFAEEERGDASFGSLLMKMVGYDAFTQALTNPLLAPAVFNRETFSDIGWAAFHDTRTLDDVFRRNTRAAGGQVASLGLRAGR
jgi:prostaglandin-endoperoxide synthase 2